MGVSMRNVRGIDVVYLNCAVCHVGAVRDTPGSPQRIVAGMPANTMDLGAFEQFLLYDDRPRPEVRAAAHDGSDRRHAG